jgi:hypothetical protein
MEAQGVKIKGFCANSTAYASADGILENIIPSLVNTHYFELDESTEGSVKVILHSNTSTVTNSDFQVKCKFGKGGRKILYGEGTGFCSSMSLPTP